MFIASVSDFHQPNLTPTLPHFHNWLSEVAVYASSSSVLDCAVRTVSLSHLGRQMQDQALVQTSRKLYRKALLNLNAVLQDPTQGLSCETLSATILLSCYELLNCTERTAWIRHAGGAGHIMRLRGAERHRTGHGKLIFLAFRNSLVVESFLSRTPCFLDTPPWRALSVDIHANSFRENPVHGVAGDFFLENVRIPGFHHDCSLINTVAEPSESALRSLVARGQAHRSNLKDLHFRILEAMEQSNRRRVELPSATGDVLFPVVYHYASISDASLLCGYWSVSQLVNMALVRLESILDDPYHHKVRQAGPAFTSDPLPPPPTHSTRRASDTRSRRQIYMAESIASARETCRTAEYMNTSAFLGPFYMVFALRGALYALEGEEREWVLNKMDDMSVNLGIAKAIADVHRNPGLSPGGRTLAPDRLV